jgi:Region found in RelA / SpoT proteins
VPSSRSRLDQLGRKLFKERLTHDEQDEVDEWRYSHDETIVEVQRALAELGYEATTRLKNLGTIAEKIAREHTRLTTIEDIAGARLVIGGGRVEQDEVVEQIVACFPGAKVRDRRVQPSHGYRAVHVIVNGQGRRKVELQIRTPRQQQRAQIVERLADRWGRQIRYGQPPDEPERSASGGGIGGLTRSTVCDAMPKIAERVAESEEMDRSLGTVYPERVLTESEVLVERLFARLREIVEDDS